MKPKKTNPENTNFPKANSFVRLSRPHVRRGFTLIELLVVLAIITLLASILFPVLNRVKRSAYSTVCLSNEKQIGVAIKLFTEDHAEHFPTFKSDPYMTSVWQSGDFAFLHDRYLRATLVGPSQVTWFSQIQAYIDKNGKTLSEIFHCPDDNRTDLKNPVSYEYKYYLSKGVRLAEIQQDTRTIMLWEQFDFHRGEKRSEFDPKARLNVLWIDGHVSNLLLSKTLTSRKSGAGPNLHDLFEDSSSDLPGDYSSDLIHF